MDAPMAQTQGTTGNTLPDSLTVKGELDMKAEMRTVSARISEALGDSIGTRFLRVVALGALLVGAAALYATISQGEGATPTAGSKFGQAYQAPAAHFEIDPAWDRAIEQRELRKDYEAMGIPWAYDEFGNVVELPAKTATDTPSNGVTLQP